MGFKLLWFCFVLLAVFRSSPLFAMMPSQKRGLPAAYYQELKAHPDAFSFQHAYLNLAKRIKLNRQLSSSAALLEPGSLPGGTAVSGQKWVYVIPILFSDSGAAPYQAAKLEEELFGRWPTGTLTDFYKENSYNRMELKGTVAPWKRVQKASDYYVGPDFSDEKGENQHCYGLCPNSKVAEMVSQALDAHPEIDWSKSDNDGPDGSPNSGDDDGFVDFVVFVHSGKGGECGDPKDIWSQQGKLTNWLSQPYTTKSARKGGGKILINDYVVVPALACDGTTMIQIGVFAHEFGHSLGLPDLYDMSRPAEWAGMGNWDLMAGGAFGGDGQSPETPSFMSPWSKRELGWVSPIDVGGPMLSVKITDWETTQAAYRIPITDSQYYLVSNREPRLFDTKLPTPGGLLVQFVDDEVVQAGLPTNSVNTKPDHPGVAIVEADGVRRLEDLNTSSEPDVNDLFPGTKNISQFDGTSAAKNLSKFSLCDISRISAGTGILVSFEDSTTCASTVGMDKRVLPRGDAGQNGVSQRTGRGVRETTMSPALRDSSYTRVQYRQEVPLSALQSNPALYMHTTVRTVGVLRASGKNYFLDVVPVLVDEEGHEIAVILPYPSEIGPSSGGRDESKGPLRLSDLFGKRVELAGSISRRALSNRKMMTVLTVTSVRVVE